MKGKLFLPFIIVLGLVNILVWDKVISNYKNKEPKFVVFEKGGRGEVDSMKFFRDTIIIYRSHWISHDTLLMRLIPTRDTIKIPQYKWTDLDSGSIKITNHKGDILFGKAVKNVYVK